MPDHHDRLYSIVYRYNIFVVVVIFLSTTCMFFFCCFVNLNLRYCCCYYYYYYYYYICFVCFYFAALHTHSGVERTTRLTASMQLFFVFFVVLQCRYSAAAIVVLWLLLFS